MTKIFGGVYYTGDSYIAQDFRHQIRVIQDWDKYKNLNFIDLRFYVCEPDIEETKYGYETYHVTQIIKMAAPPVDCCDFVEYNLRDMI